ncbi:MAG: hypothetical protein LBF63_03120, partial [Treponema sp.]|nr:hypothetical protein [Treponema sp.]
IFFLLVFRLSCVLWLNYGAFIGAMRRHIGLINNLRLCLGRHGCRLDGLLKNGTEAIFQPRKG